MMFSRISYRRINYYDRTLIGVCLMGRITCRDSILERIFGVADEGSAKSKREWAIVLSDGKVEHRVVIYDWDKERETMSRHRWRVESHTLEAMEILIDIILQFDNCHVSQ